MYIFYFIFIFSRFLVYYELDQKGFLKVFNKDYLSEDFLDLIIFNHTIPNGHLILEKLLNYLYINNSLLFYLLNILYTISLCYFVNDIFKNLKLNKNIRIFILILLSTILIPYETWRVSHHDHINLFIISYLFWSLFKFINFNEKFNHLIFALILLNLFYTLGFVYFLFISFYLVLIKKLNYIKIEKYDYIKLFSVLLVIISIFTKNYISASVFSSTSMGGANLIQRTVHAIGEKNYENLIHINNQKFPNWWKNVHKEIILRNHDENLEDSRISNLAHGKLDHDVFENFKKQKKLIKNTSNLEKDLENLLKKESQNFKLRKWLYNYGYKENLLSTKYQSYGNIIFIEACKTYPLNMLIGNLGNKGVLLTSIQMLSHGGLLPNYYEKEFKYKNRPLIILNNIMRVLILLIIVLTPFILLKKINFKVLSKNDIFYLFLVFFLFVIIILSSIITCCENPRMLVMQFFLLILICVMNCTYLFKKNNLIKK